MQAFLQPEEHILPQESPISDFAKILVPGCKARLLCNLSNGRVWLALLPSGHSTKPDRLPRMISRILYLAGKVGTGEILL